MTEAESSSESPAAAVGFGPNAGGTFSQENYHHPAAGWGAAKSVTGVLLKQGEILDGTRVVLKTVRSWIAKYVPEYFIQFATKYFAKTLKLGDRNPFVTG